MKVMSPPSAVLVILRRRKPPGSPKFEKQALEIKHSQKEKKNSKKKLSLFALAELNLCL